MRILTLAVHCVPATSRVRRSRESRHIARGRGRRFRYAATPAEAVSSLSLSPRFLEPYRDALDLAANAPHCPSKFPSCTDVAALIGPHTESRFIAVLPEIYARQRANFAKVLILSSFVNRRGPRWRRELGESQGGRLFWPTARPAARAQRLARRAEKESAKRILRPAREGLFSVRFPAAFFCHDIFLSNTP